MTPSQPLSLAQKPADYSVLFLDMNAYFASVEQQVQSTLRGLPVAIAPYTGSTGCIIARSYEAKEWGVNVGDNVASARKKCPKIKVIEARPALYQLYHKEIFKVLNSNAPQVTALSIDEFIIRLTGRDQTKTGAFKLADNIKSDLKNIADYMTCSIGIGPNYFLAKVAGESKKPNGTTLIKLSNLDGFYKKIKLRDIPGINFRMERQLAERKIYSAYDFYNKSLMELSCLLKFPGKVWYYRMRGWEVDEFVIKNKTVGHSHVLPPELRTPEKALSVLEKLASKVAYRLRREKLWARGIAIRISFLSGGGFADYKHCALFNDTGSIIREVRSMIAKCRNWQDPLYVAINTFDLVSTANRQVSIFADIERSRAMSEALDKINDEHGANTAFYASSFEGRKAAPDRIPFGMPRYEIRH